MRSLLSIASWVLFFSENVHAIIHISPQNVSGNAQTWDLSRKSRCLVLAHQSLVLKNDEHHLLILDGGFGRFNLKFNGSDADVNDLNPYTAAFDLSKDFKLYELEPLWQSKKTRDIPVLSQFGLWSDSTQNRLYMNGGHFFAESKWQGSDFYIPKEQIPPYNIYEFDLISRSWKPSLTSSDAKRTFSGASATIPSLNQSFFLGGITDSYTSASSKLQVFETQSQLVHFDHTSHQLDVRKYYADDETEGYWHGTLEHIPVGCDDGLLISLMSQKNDLNTQHSDLTASNDEAGFAVSWETVRLYDVRGKRWYQQNTSWPDDGPPPTRTRFCSSVVHDKELNTWDLWVHGGQQLGANSTEGVDDIWVLSMPSFTWVRLPTVVPRENRLRSHKCHAVGGQLLLVGGYPPEDDLDKDDPPCDPFIVKVLDMNAVIPEWKGTYSTNSIYKSSDTIREAVPVSQKSPQRGGWADPAIQKAFGCTKPSDLPPPTPSAGSSSDSGPTQSSKLGAGAIAGIVIGALVVLVLVALLLWCCLKKKRKERSASEVTTAYSSGTFVPKHESMNEHVVGGLAPQKSVRTVRHEMGDVSRPISNHGSSMGAGSGMGNRF